MQSTCPQGHEHELGDLDLTAGDVRWECPNCQAVSIIPGTPPPPLLTHDEQLPEDVLLVTDGDTGSGTTQ